MRLLTALFAFLFTAGTVAAQPATYITVCTTGCDYNNLQTAINSITDSSITKPYTVFIESGILSVDTDISIANKHYINFVGHAPGASVVEASASWFTNTTTGNLLTISGSTNLTFRGFTIDAFENDDGTHVKDFGAVISEDWFDAGESEYIPSDEILMEDMELRGSVYGWWHADPRPDNGRFRIFNSIVFSNHYALVFDTAIWHIFGSEIRAVNDGTKSQDGATENAFGIQQIGGNMVVWGSHVHAESSLDTIDQVIGYRSQGNIKGTFVGTTLHARLTVDGVSAEVEAFDIHSGAAELHLIGSELLYESATSDTGSTIAGLGYRGGASGTTLDLVGTDIIDGGGSGGSTRGDLVQVVSCPGPPVANNCQPTIRAAGSSIQSTANAGSKALTTTLAQSENNTNMQSGSATFTGGGSVSVNLPVALPSSDYRVLLTGNSLELFSVTGKTSTGFTINSAAPGGSSATVDWLLIR
ncbi:hypothetical protein ABI59_07510 [Acidobacteria bacterium Mor1]|nr:hypothetical protein ABI59_07510 [Acidobacteria bacterium Mor1]